MRARGDDERGVDVDVHDLEPAGYGVLRDGRARSQQSGVVEDAVQSPVFATYGVDQNRRRVFAGVLEIGGDDHGTCLGAGLDEIEHGLQFAFSAPKEHNIRTVLGIGQRRRSPDAVSGARHQDDPASEKIGSRGVCPVSFSGHAACS